MYNINTKSDYNLKLQLISQLFDRAQNGNADKFHINYMSATGLFKLGIPYLFARNSLGGTPKNYPVIKRSIIPLDFPGESVIQHIINQNFEMREFTTLAEGNWGFWQVPQIFPK